MGLLARSIRAASMEDPTQPLLPASALNESLGLGRSDAGVMVNEKQAMRLTTVFACINIISTDISTLSFSIFQTMPDGSTREAIDHRLYKMLNSSPNGWMSSLSFRGAMFASVLGWGNAYAVIRRDGAARPASLQILPSDRTCPAMVNGDLIYVTTATADGMPAKIDPENMIHIQGLSYDGILGMSPIGTCKNAFGIAMAAEKFGAQFFGNGLRATGVFTHPGELNTEAQENIKKSVREMATGENALRPLILEEGMTWTQTTIPPNDAQFLETRRFQRSELAAIYRMPLHLLQDLERSTNNNIEHQSLDYLRYTLRPLAVKFETEVNRKLLSGPFKSQHDFNEFQRGDFASQTAGWNLLRNIGVYSANDILKAMRQNPIPEAKGGDVRIVAANMVTLEAMATMKEMPAAAGKKQLPAPGETTDSDQGEAITDGQYLPIVAGFRRLVRDAAGRITNRKEWDQEFARRTLHPVIATMAQAILASAGLSAELTEHDEVLVNGVAGGFAGRSQAWTKANVSQSATAATEDAFFQLRLLLLGGS